MSLVNNSDKELTGEELDVSWIPDYKASVGVAMQNPNLARNKSLEEAMNFLGLNSLDNKLTREVASLYSTLERKVVNGDPLTDFQKEIYSLLKDKITGERYSVSEFGAQERYRTPKLDNFAPETTIINNSVYVFKELKKVLGDRELFELVNISEILTKMDPDVIESMFDSDSKALGDMEFLLLSDPDSISAAYGISKEEASTLVASGLFRKEIDQKFKEKLLAIIRSIKEEAKEAGTAK